MSKHSTSGLTPSAKPTPGEDGAGTVTARTAAVPRPRLDEGRVLGCEYGHYPWDEWERWAIARGLDRELAALGRLTVREAYQHQWDDRLKSLCGWRDDGRRMVKLALHLPSLARKRWQRLLDTDGYRGEYDPKTGEWKSWQ
jgi:hypothetical protein